MKLELVEVEHVREALREALSETLLEELLARIVLPRVAVQAAVSVPEPPPSCALLTAREHEVLRCVARGDSNKTIARTFDLSVHTVKRHVANILGKLGVSSRVQAATWLHARH
jgi:two-component system, NarL family, nitrate/nitrite response regulator NarL